jgi:hypothetical protein
MARFNESRSAAQREALMIKKQTELVAEESGLTERCATMAVDFLESVPGGQTHT